MSLWVPIQEDWLSQRKKVLQIVSVARDLSDCTNDAEAFRLALIKSIDYQCKHGLHECHLSNCLDMHAMLSLLVGDKSNVGPPYNVASLNR